MKHKAQRSKASRPARHSISWRQRLTSLVQSMASMSNVLLIILVVAAICLVVPRVQHYERYLAYCNNKAQSLAVKLGLVLKNVYLEGQVHVKNAEIRDALKVAIGQPILSVPIEEIKKRLEHISWVKYAIVERQLPSDLFIGLIERRPVALWQNRGKLYLIDDEGTPILEEHMQPFSHLVILIGDDAPLNIDSLFNIIGRDKELQSKVSFAIRVGERRWNIRFYNGVEVKLPEEEPEKQWDYLSSLHKNKNLFAKDVVAIDLRIPSKIYIKSKEHEVKE